MLLRGWDPADGAPGPANHDPLVGCSAEGVLHEVIRPVPDVQFVTAVPTAAEVAADGRLAVGGSPGRAMPEVGVVEQDITPLLVDSDLTGNPLEPERDALGTAEMASREQAEESVGRGGRIEVDGEGNPGPDVQMGSGLVVGVPADARVSRTRVRPGVLVHDAKLLVVEQPGVRTEEPLRHVDQRRVVDPLVGTSGGNGGEADVVDEGPAVDGGARLVEDHRPMAGVETTLGQQLYGLDQLFLHAEQRRLVEDASKGCVAVGIEERHQVLDLPAGEHAGRPHTHAGPAGDTACSSRSTSRV